jgi:glutamate--cysteine ligase
VQARPYSARNRVHLVDETDVIPIKSVDDLIAGFHAAGKPRSEARVGSEHELIGVRRRTTPRGPIGSAPAYEGPDGIGAVLDGFASRGWEPVMEDGHVIALGCTDAQVTIEPGGQFELAARPVTDDRTFVSDIARHTRTLGDISGPLGLAWLSTGFRPFGRREDVPWMPKVRYRVMRDYMPTVGTRGLDMMQRTATVQSNLDFVDEADALATMRCLYSVTPILTALWANSPIVDGVPSGFQSYRAWVWRDTDNARAGLLPFVFERDDLFRAYTDWALDVPMYFVYRGGYQPPDGMTFRAFLANGWRGERANQSDWALHLSTLFPEARLKRFIEVRGCDCGSFPMITALGPLCRGLLYDDDARAAATALTADLTFAERQRISDEVPRQGLATKVGGQTIGVLARELLAIVKSALRGLAPDSVPLLAPVEDIVLTGRTQADVAVDAWNAADGDVAQQIKAMEHPGL